MLFLFAHWLCSCCVAEGRVVALLIVPNIYVVPRTYVVAVLAQIGCVPACCSMLKRVGVCRCRCVVSVVTSVIIVSCFWRVVVIDVDVCLHIC